MGREFFLAGISGYRPDLCYNPVEDLCAVRVPGYDKPIAMLPSNTVDAVLTSKGVLAYRGSRGEVHALQVPDHEPIYKAAVAASHKEDEAQKSFGTGTPFSQIMGRHTGGLVSGGIVASELSGHGPYRSQGTKESMDDAVNRIVTGKDASMNDGSGNNMMVPIGNTIVSGTISADRIPSLDSTKISPGKITVTADSSHAVNTAIKGVYEKFAADLVREHIAPLVKNVQHLTTKNAELTANVRQLEKLLADREATQPVAAVRVQDHPIREVSWGDQSGLPNFLHPQDNPFCGKRRG